MKSIQIIEQILIRSDEDLLQTLPTEQRLACNVCDTVTINKRDSGKFYCPQCKAEKEVKMITWYYKNRTSDPIIAIERHRQFWKGIYFEQLARESLIKPDFKLLQLLPDFQIAGLSRKMPFEKIFSFMKGKFQKVLNWN